MRNDATAVIPLELAKGEQEPVNAPPGDARAALSKGGGALGERFAGSPKDDLWLAARAILQARRSGSCLVPLQPRGSRPPLFFLPGRSGKVSAYRNYARELGPDQPFYTLEPPGMDGSTDDFASRIEDFASRYLIEVRKIQPRGPYYFCGFCAGGAIAFEMAQQLRRQGEETALLVLIDTWNPRHAKWQLSLRRFRRQIAKRGAAGRKMRYLVGWLGRALRWAVLHPLRKPFRVRGKALPPPLRYSSVSQATQDANDYRPQPYPGKIVLFRGVDLAPGGGVGPDLGWGSVALGGVEVHEMAAGHTDFTTRGDVIEELAAEIREVLDQAHQRQLAGG